MLDAKELKQGHINWTAKKIDLKKELISAFGKQKTNEILEDIKEKFKTLFPILPESIKSCGIENKFSEDGSLINPSFNTEQSYFDYLITFKRESFSKDGMVDKETIYYPFN